MKRLSCVRLCVLYQSAISTAISTAIGVGPAFRAKIVWPSSLMLQRFYHDTRHCINFEEERR